MNRSSSSWTGRAPRTCQQAFGPYTNHRIENCDQPHASAAVWLAWAALLMSVIACVLAVTR